MIRETVKEAMKLRNVKSKDLAEYIEVKEYHVPVFERQNELQAQKRIENKPEKK